MQDFHYQPAWVDFSIFWGMIVAGVGLAVIIQMEIGGYDFVYWPAVIFLIVVLLAGVWQSQRLVMHVDEKGVRLRRGMPQNTMQLPINTIINVDTNKHSLIIHTRSYGKIKLVRLAKIDSLITALTQVGIHVTPQGEKHV